MQRHVTDAELLEFLDGEMSMLRRWQVRILLFRCWECRSRMTELEQQAHRFAQALRNDTFPGPKAVSLARRRFELWHRAMTPAAPAGSGISRSRMSWTAGVCAAAAVVCFAWLRPAPPAAQAPALVSIPASSAPRPVGVAKQPTAPPVRDSPARTEAAIKAPKPRLHPVDLNLVEADVHYRLHRIGACAAEPVLIVRKGPNQLLVTAVGPPESRSREIRNALSDLEASGAVTFEATGGAPAGVRPEAVGDASRGAIQSRTIESPLARSFPSPEDFDRHAGKILKLADSIYAQAWALQRHLSLGASKTERNSPVRWLGEVMERDHSSRILADVGRLRAELKPVAMPAGESCPQTGLNAFEEAGELTVLVHRLLEPSTAEEIEAVDRDTRRLSEVLHFLECSVR